MFQRHLGCKQLSHSRQTDGGQERKLANPTSATLTAYSTPSEGLLHPKPFQFQYLIDPSRLFEDVFAGKHTPYLTLAPGTANPLLDSATPLTSETLSHTTQAAVSPLTLTFR